jgi:hypothetical protein
VQASNEISYSKVVKAYQDAALSFIVKAYPNPVTEVLTISVNHFNNYADIELQDINGTVLRKKRMTRSLAQINIQDLVPGIYILKFKDEHNTRTIKVNKR